MMTGMREMGTAMVTAASSATMKERRAKRMAEGRRLRGLWDIFVGQCMRVVWRVWKEEGGRLLPNVNI